MNWHAEGTLHAIRGLHKQGHPEFLRESFAEIQFGVLNAIQLLFLTGPVTINARTTGFFVATLERLGCSTES
jgi:hypothetical protein